MYVLYIVFPCILASDENYRNCQVIENCMLESVMPFICLILLNLHKTKLGTIIPIL